MKRTLSRRELRLDDAILPFVADDHILVLVQNVSLLVGFHVIKKSGLVGARNELHRPVALIRLYL